MLKRYSILKKAIAAALALSIGLSFGGCGGGAGFLGLQDYQRDLLGAVGGLLAGAILKQVIPGLDDDSDHVVRAIPGPAGQAGAPGPTFFSVFVNRFYGAQFGDGFDVTPVRNDSPTLGEGGGPIGYRFLVPSIFGIEGKNLATAQADHVATPVSMRLFLRRIGECNGGCMAFSIDARRLVNGDSAPRCFGGSAEDCSDGTRWVLVGPVCAEGDTGKDLFLNVDLPLGAGGLGYPDIRAGEYLAFELNPFSSDGGTYRLLGVEFYDRLGAAIANATVYTDRNSIPAECPGGEVNEDPDCNENGKPDAMDIADGTSQDCNGNGVPDECDIAGGGSQDSNQNGIPDECEDCNHNGVIDSQDIAGGTSRDCNDNDVPDECDIAAGTSQDSNGNGVPDECEDCNHNGVPDDLDIANGTSRDCNNNDVPDECDIANGTSADSNGNGIPDECEPLLPDCNNNGVPDDEDIRNGTSQDCNENEIPDECDIASGHSRDANGNGVPDECEDCNGNGVPDDEDIRNGTSQDCNENEVPDECDIRDGTSDDVNQNGVPDECEDCNGNGVPDDEDIRNGTSQDCNENEVPDECDIRDGTSQDANQNGVPDECEDCNGNGVPDDEDIRNGTSQDCNENEVPDECDIRDGTSDDSNNNGVPDECEDCNGNGVPDDVDIHNGTSQDCNENEVPDECDIRDGTSQDANQNGVPDECEPPDCGPAADVVLTLWPPNHRMVDIDLAAVTGITHSTPLTFVVDSITQDEPLDTNGDGETEPDGAGIGTGVAQVRAERSGNLNGRVYQVNFTVLSDEGSCSASILVTVPHDPTRPAIDDGQNYDSTGGGGGNPLQGPEEYCDGGSRVRTLTMLYAGLPCSASDHAQSPDRVSCSGNPAMNMPLHIIASDRSNPFSGGATVWFDGIVGLGDTFNLDAARAGLSRLKSETWIHLIRPGGNVLQSVRLDTSCTQPLRQGDEFGGVMVEYVVPE